MHNCVLVLESPIISRKLFNPIRQNSQTAPIEPIRCSRVILLCKYQNLGLNQTHTRLQGGPNQLLIYTTVQCAWLSTHFFATPSANEARPTPLEGVFRFSPPTQMGFFQNLRVFSRQTFFTLPNFLPPPPLSGRVMVALNVHRT